MLSKKMKMLFSIVVVTFSFVMTTNVSFAIMGIEQVSKERAKALGVEVRAKASGPKHIWVELEFKPKGELKKFNHVSMEIREGKELLVGYAPIQTKRTNSGTIVFSFMANRAYLEKITLRVVEGDPLNMNGHDLQLKEFVDLKKLP